jgi:hypothetical protein
VLHAGDGRICRGTVAFFAEALSALTQLSNSPFPAGTFPTSVAVDPSGKRL